MKPLIVVASEAREFSGLPGAGREDKLLDLPLDFARSRHWQGREWILVANGPGPRLASEAVETAAAGHQPEAVLSIGFCGGLDPAIPLYGIVCATGIHSARETWVCSQPSTRKPFISGTIVSLDRVATTPEEKVRLRDRRHAAVEMEAAALAGWAAVHGVPFYCVRVVTDCAGEGFSLDFNRLRDENGRFSRKRILAKAAAHPVKLLPELIRLNRRSKVAAGLLGDFLADCRF